MLGGVPGSGVVIPLVKKTLVDPEKMRHEAAGAAALRRKVRRVQSGNAKPQPAYH
jgi:hypothetical protein